MHTWGNPTPLFFLGTGARPAIRVIISNDPAGSHLSVDWEALHCSATTSYSLTLRGHVRWRCASYDTMDG